MAYNVKQITTLINDVVEDMTGQSAAAQTLETTDIVSLGKAIANAGLTEGFFGALCNRLAKTVYFIRLYNGNEAPILRDEHEYGAFVQKVYYTSPAFTDNYEYGVPDNSSPAKYQTKSPYDVTATVAVSGKVFDSQGTFSLNIVRPVDQIRSAFLSEAEMMRFIDGIYVCIENELELAKEGLVNTAVATAMAYDLENGMGRNLLAEYNATLPQSATPLAAADCLYDADFLRYAGMQIKRTIDFMQKMSTEFNSGGYKTFSPRDAIILQVLGAFSDATDVYLTSDTYHQENVSLPGYVKTPYWQRQADDTVQGFAEISEIKIKHSSLSGTGSNHIVNQTGIIAFVHDIEHVAAYFGHRRSWEKYNEIQDLYVHGESARNGFAVDPNANGVVFYVADVSN